MNVKLFLIAALFLQAFSYATTAFGQFCQPVTVTSCPPVTYVAPPTTHHIQNVPGGEKSRFYSWVELPSGYKTQIPVINGILPKINVSDRGGRITDLWLDYSQGNRWKSEMRGKTVKYDYNRPEPKSEPRPRSAPRTIPAPREREEPRWTPVPKDRDRTPEPVRTPDPVEIPVLKRVQVPVPKVSEKDNTSPLPIPQPKQTSTDDAASVLQSINERLETIQKRTEKIDDLSNRMENVERKVESIDELRQRLDRLEVERNASVPLNGSKPKTVKSGNDEDNQDVSPPVPKLNEGMRRPSDIDIPEPDNTKTFPRYGE